MSQRGQRVSALHMFNLVVRYLVGLGIALLITDFFLLAGLVVPLRVSGGSMAPTLLGQHYAMPCERCGAPLCWDVDSPPRNGAACSNCGSRGNDPDRAALEPGQRMLVDRSAYQWRPPRRWEKIVLRSAADPTKLGVKRVVGLPGEEVRVSDGDIYINGRIARKDFPTQLEMSLAVHDTRYRDSASQGPPRWRPESDRSIWRPMGAGFEYATDAPRMPLAATQPVLLGHGTAGQAFRQAAFEPEPQSRRQDRPTSSGTPVSRSLEPQSGFDWLAYHHELTANPASGASSSDILDDVSYNQGESRVLNPVRDLILRCYLQADPRGQLAWQLESGGQIFRVTVELATGKGQLVQNGRRRLEFSATPLGRAQWVLAEVSATDRQLRLAVDRRVVLDYSYADTAARPSSPRTRLKIGARAANIQINWLEVRRDIFYTDLETRQTNLAGSPAYRQMGEYFVLGDNSPNSEDSRGWPRQAVTEALLVGKPLVWPR